MGQGITKIVPGLFIGNIRDSKDSEKLAALKITHILSIHDGAKKCLPDKTYLCIDAKDTVHQNLLQHFHECSVFIHEARLAGGSVLVHCLAGISRSVTVTCAYLMLVTGHEWTHVLDAVRQARACANPNFSFQQQLARFQREFLATEKRKWAARWGAERATVGGDDARVGELYEQWRARERLKRELAEQKQQDKRHPAAAPVTGSARNDRFPLNDEPDVTSPSSYGARRSCGGVFFDDAVDANNAMDGGRR